METSTSEPRTWIARARIRVVRFVTKHPAVVVPLSMLSFVLGYASWGVFQAGARFLADKGDVLVAVSSLVQAGLIAYATYHVARMQMRHSMIDHDKKERNVRYALDGHLRDLASSAKSILEYVENSSDWTKKEDTVEVVLSNIRDCQLERVDIPGAEVLKPEEVDSFQDINEIVDKANKLIRQLGRKSAGAGYTSWREPLAAQLQSTVVDLGNMATAAHEQCRLRIVRKKTPATLPSASEKPRDFL